MLAFPELALVDAMLTRLLVLAIFQSVNKEVESASSRSAEWLKASYTSKSGFGSQLLSPLGYALISE